MKILSSLVAAVGAAALLAGSALAADAPTPVPFPAAKGPQVFVSAQTVATDGTASNYFAPGSTVVFRAVAVDGKTQKPLVAKDVKFFYVTIPGQPNLKLAYNPKAAGASAAFPWVSSWRVPSDYAAGLVPFRVMVKSKAKRVGAFEQMPVASAQLTIQAAPPAAPVAAVSPGTALPAKVPVSLYVDTVNGTRPAAAAPRPIGCTQTNVFKRGEQLVLRTWGVELASGDVLSADNVDTAYFTLPGQPNVTLNWGAHGATGAKVWFWTNAWNIPSDYPLGDVTIKVTFKTDSGKTGVLDYPITIIP